MMGLFTAMGRLGRCTSGTAMLEGALVMPLAISLMVGGVEFGRAFSTYATADKTMRNAARYLASVPKDGVCVNGDNAWGRVNARKLAVYGKLDPTDEDQPLIEGFATGDITISPDVACGDDWAGVPVVLTFEADVTFQSVMLGAVGLDDAISFTVSHEERHIAS